MREVDSLKAKNQKLKSTFQRLQGEMGESKKTSTEVRGLKTKVMTFLSKQMREKGLHAMADKTQEGIEKKVGSVVEYYD